MSGLDSMAMYRQIRESRGNIPSHSLNYLSRTGKSLEQMMHRKFQNLSLAKKLTWRRAIQEIEDCNKKVFPELFREDGSLDLIAVANRAQRMQR